MRKSIGFFLLFLFSFMFGGILDFVNAEEAGANEAIYGYADHENILVPIDILASHFDANVEYNKKTGDIFIELDGIQAELVVGLSEIRIDGKEKSMSAKPIDIKNQVYLPAREFIHFFPIRLQYDHQKNTLTIAASGDQHELTIHIKPIDRAYLYHPEHVDVLMFHSFSETTSSSSTVTVDQFEKHLVALKNAGYETITIADLIEYKNNPHTFLPKKPVLISIDDGYKDNYTHAYPLLREHGLRATIFAIVGRRGNVGTYSQHFSWSEAMEMVQSGVIDIQSHTYDSHDYTADWNNFHAPTLTSKKNGESTEQYQKRLLDDIQQSKRFLENQLGNDVRSISFPFGRYNETVLKAAKKSGFALFFTINEATNTQQTLQDGLVNRINVHGNFTSKDLLKKMHCRDGSRKS